MGVGKGIERGRRREGAAVSREGELDVVSATEDAVSWTTLVETGREGVANLW